MHGGKGSATTNGKHEEAAEPVPAPKEGKISQKWAFCWIICKLRPLTWSFGAVIRVSCWADDIHAVLSATHTATYCNTVLSRRCPRLRDGNTHGNTLQYTTTHLWADVILAVVTATHTATHCYTLQHTSKYCNTLQLAGIYCNTLQLTST